MRGTASPERGGGREADGGVFLDEDKDYYFTGYNHKMLEQVRSLRREMTRQEKRLWYDFLKTYPEKFYRQRSIDRYIVDFYCSAARIVIELDGSQHYTQDGIQYDLIRTEVLERYGLLVLRFPNAEIDEHFEAVCMLIDQSVKQRIIK